MNELTRQDVIHLMNEASKHNGRLIDHPRSFASKSQMKDFYQTYGYITLKNAVPSGLLAAIRSDLTAIFGSYSTNKEHPVDSAIINLDKSDKQKLYELHLATSKLVSFKTPSTFFTDILKSISGSDAPVLEIGAGWLLSISNDKRLVYDFHQESNYMKGFDDVFSFHYPLLRTSTLENGTMSILPGSHRYGTLSFNKNRISNNSYTDLIPINIDEITKELPELHCYLELGDVCVFHKDLIHKSNFNASPLCRPVGVSRYTQSIDGDWINRKPDEL